MISSTSDYALRAVILLATEYNREPVRANAIAEVTGAPRNYMGKTLNALVKAGVLKSARGPQGGFSLALPPEDITIARVIDCFVEPRPHSRCLLGNKQCDPANPCAGHNLWADISRTRREPFARTTIADIVGTSNQPAL